MGLGLTVPLQGFLKINAPACGMELDQHLCRELHSIVLQDRSIAGNALPPQWFA